MDKQEQEVSRVGRTIHEATINTLKERGQVISEAHNDELATFALAVAYDIVVRPEKNKVVIELQTGMGKTTMLAHIPAAAKNCGYDYPMLVSVPNLTAMVEFNEGLGKTDFDMDEVGYAYNAESRPEITHGHLPEPTSMDIWTSKRVMLCCHARMDHKREDWDILIDAGDQARTVFYDEALKYGKAFNFKVEYLQDELKDLNRFLPVAVREWFNRLLNGVNKLAESKDEPNTITLLAFDESIATRPNFLLESVERAEQRYKEDGRYERDRFRVLKEIAGNRFEYFRLFGGSCFCFSYDLPLVSGLFVLDASHKHSKLSQKDGEFESFDLGNAKRYDQVKAIAYDGKLSREKINGALQSHIDWVVKMYGIYGNKALYVTLLEHKQAVINALLMAYPDKFNGDELLSVIHWGMHTGLNKFSDREHLVCLGLLRMATDDIPALMAMTEGTYFADIDSYGTIAAERAILDLYQAVSRGRCRISTVDEHGLTQALPMTIHLSGELKQPEQEFLKKVMPGIYYASSSDEVKLKIVTDYLSGRVEDISSSDLKKFTGLTEQEGTTKREWNRLIDLLETQGKWHREGRSIKLRDKVL